MADGSSWLPELALLEGSGRSSVGGFRGRPSPGWGWEELQVLEMGSSPEVDTFMRLPFL